MNSQQGVHDRELVAAERPGHARQRRQGMEPPGIEKMRSRIADATNQGKSRHRRSDGALTEKVKRILIVDDEVDIASSIQYVLKQEGFATLLAHDGWKAMELYQAQRPDLLILDLMMPGLDGYEVCRRVRSLDQKTPILMLTARTSEIDTVVGLELGANDY